MWQSQLSIDLVVDARSQTCIKELVLPEGGATFAGCCYKMGLSLHSISVLGILRKVGLTAEGVLHNAENLSMAEKSGHIIAVMRSQTMVQLCDSI